MHDFLNLLIESIASRVVSDIVRSCWSRYYCSYRVLFIVYCCCDCVSDNPRCQQKHPASTKTNNNPASTIIPQRQQLYSTSATTFDISNKPPDVNNNPRCQRDVCKDRKSTRLNSSHTVISYAVFCLK